MYSSATKFDGNSPSMFRASARGPMLITTRRSGPFNACIQSKQCTCSVVGWLQVSCPYTTIQNVTPKAGWVGQRWMQAVHLLSPCRVVVAGFATFHFTYQLAQRNTNTHLYTQTHTHTHRCTRTYTRTHTNTHTPHARTQNQTQAHTHAHAHTLTRHFASTLVPAELASVSVASDCCDAENATVSSGCCRGAMLHTHPQLK